MVLRRENDRFVLDCTFQQKETAKAAGFRWDPAARQWWTDNILSARRLRDYADVETEAYIDARVKESNDSINASRAVDADIGIPAPAGLEYLPFQRAGIAYASSRAATLIGDEMGLGKTIQAIGVINADPTVKSVLVICPASLKLNWERELKKWLVRRMKISIIDSKGDNRYGDIIIINYDILEKYRALVTSKQWDMLIVDESHYLKNPKAKRTQMVFGRQNRDDAMALPPIAARRRLFLTGTPIVNRPIELWPMLHSMLPHDLGKSWWGYANRYCNLTRTRYGTDVSGAKNLEELQERLRSTIMVRRLKRDVLKELPAKRRQVIEVEANGMAGAVEAEHEAFRAYESTMVRLRADVEMAKAAEDECEYTKAVDRLREGSAVAFNEISRARHELALSKIPAVIVHIQDVLRGNDGAKIVVFCHHRDVVRAIWEQFQDISVVVTGDMEKEERQISVDRFQAENSMRVFIGTIGAAGVGLTLTAAAHVIFAELDWVPGNVTQAEDRCHRIGQTDSVLVQHLVVQESLDARMAHILVRKQDVIDKALDRDYSLDLRIPVIPGVEEATTATTRRRQLDETAETLDSTMIGTIHSGIKIIAGLCDGARSIDGMGFGKIDVHIGTDLARQRSLSPRQAALALRLLKKYRRQLPESMREMFATKKEEIES